MKWLSLVAFTVQNAAFVLLMRASKVLAPTKYNSTVAVVVTEVLKLPLSLLLLCYEKRGVGAAWTQLRRDVCGQPMDTLKLSIPALLYTLQNNCLFIAVEHLEAAVFQVTYQLKTLTTAVLTVVMLGRPLKVNQWIALLLLMAGAAMVQEPKKGGKKGAEASNRGLVLGITATVFACVCSSVASVYLEKILVESKPSVWVRAAKPGPTDHSAQLSQCIHCIQCTTAPWVPQVRNVQLCLFTIPIAVATALRFAHHDAQLYTEPLHGFGGLVWAAIVTNAAGGTLQRATHTMLQIPVHPVLSAPLSAPLKPHCIACALQACSSPRS